MNYENGKLHGSNMMWLNNGQKYFEINSKNGRRDGVNIYWFTNGQKKSEANFKNGEKISSKQWNEKGELIEETFSPVKN